VAKKTHNELTKDENNLNQKMLVATHRKCLIPKYGFLAIPTFTKNKTLTTHQNLNPPTHPTTKKNLFFHTYVKRKTHLSVLKNYWEPT
jgi:hypothetical protein